VSATETDGPAAELSVDGDALLVVGESLTSDRNARLFFRSVVGAEPLDNGFRCPRRRLSMTTLALRVFDWLEARGYAVTRTGLADEAITRELERRRSFNRTRDAAQRLKSGDDTFSFAAVDDALAQYSWARALRPHQRQALAHGLTAINAANFSVPGAGKTASTLALAVNHLHAATIDLVVVVGPLACFGPWEQESFVNVGARIAVRRVRGPARRRLAAYDSSRPGQILLLSYATAAADQAALLDLFDRYRVMLVVDESHRAKRFRGGLWAPALLELARRARVRTILSGTPMPQSGRDLYTQLNVLWPDGQLTGTRDAFAARVDTDFGGVVRDLLPFATRTPKSELGLPPYELFTHDVPLTGIQAEVYDLVASGFRRDLADAPTWQDKLETLRRARPIRLLQAATNPDLLNMRDTYYRLPAMTDRPPTLMERLLTYRSHETPAKSLAALGLIEEIAANDGKVVCWSNFVSNLDQFAELVRERLHLPVYQVDGRVPAGSDALHVEQHSDLERAGEEDTRELVIYRFLHHDGPAVLVTNPASCSESISLHSTCHHAIYLDRTYDCALYLQSIDRIHRLGLPDDVIVRVHLLRATADGLPTIDGLVDAALTRKSETMLALLEGAELAPGQISEDAAVDAEGDQEDLAALLRYLLGETE
jgi:SNF2 family DNA or RNA helicase